MRVRSGRSGRRLGSQKPGTAWGAASVAGLGTVCAAAVLPDSAAASTATAAHFVRRPAGRRDFACGNRAICNESGRSWFDLEGLIDHPPGNSSAVSVNDSSRLALKIMLQVGRGLFGGALEVEGGDEVAVAIHKIHQCGVVHGVVAVL